VLAHAALRAEERDDVVADREVGDARPDRLHDARALVPEDGRRVARRVHAGGGVHVGVAHAAGDEAHERLALARVCEVDLRDLEGLPERLEHGRADLHDRDPTSRA
jgi:hypothetical protein